MPREEFVKVEIKENEEAVQKMLVEATREFKEVVVQGRPDFEIHIIMCDDDLPTPKEES